MVTSCKGVCDNVTLLQRATHAEHCDPIVTMQAQHHYSPLIMVGDGATDLEARQEGGADLFIGYV